MKKPAKSSEQARSRMFLLACIVLMGLGILMGNFVGGSLGSAAAMLLVAAGSMFGIAYLREVNR